MADIFIFAEITTSGAQVRDTYVKRLSELSENALNNEPGVLKYAILLPRNPSDEKTVFIVEQEGTRTQEAFDMHMNAAPVQDMIQWMMSKSVLEGTPKVYKTTCDEAFRFSRPELNAHNDPYICFAELDYKTGGVEKARPYWRAVVVDGLEKETGTLDYGVYSDPENMDVLYTFEVYESDMHLWDIHVKGQAVQESIKNTKDLRNGLNHNFLKFQAGYLRRSS